MNRIPTERGEAWSKVGGAKRNGIERLAALSGIDFLTGGRTVCRSIDETGKGRRLSGSMSW